MTIISDRGVDAAAVQPPPRTAVSTARALVRATRPKQWIKNVLVLAAPAAAGVLFQPAMVWRTAVAVATFTACAAGGYLVNDAADVERDRLHPTKRFRPVASGLIPVRLAWMAGVSLVAGSIAVGGLTTNGKLAAVLAGYVALTLSYSLWLKHIAIIELMAVAGGFLLRPMAGAAATDVPVSRWFIIVASFGSLYMVVGKRYAEVTELGDGAANHRRILSAYPAEYLRQTRELAAGVTLLAYCLWAFERAPSSGPPWSQLSIIPITFGLLRYALLLEKGQGGAPEEVVLRDRQLLVTGLIWVLLFGLSAAKVGT